MDTGGDPGQNERELLMRLVEELTNKPVASLADAAEQLYRHFVRYRRTQAALNESAGFGLSDPTHLDVFDTCLMLSERYSSLTRSIRTLEATRQAHSWQQFRAE